MSWETFSRRKGVMDAVLAEVDYDGTDEIPGPWREEIDRVFGGQEEFLCALYYRWANALNARLVMLLDGVPDDDGSKVRDIAEQLAGRSPATVRLLARYAGSPPLAAAMERHRKQMPLAAGVNIARLAETIGSPRAACDDGPRDYEDRCPAGPGEVLRSRVFPGFLPLRRRRPGERRQRGSGAGRAVMRARRWLRLFRG